MTNVGKNEESVILMNFGEGNAAKSRAKKDLGLQAKILGQEWVNSHKKDTRTICIPAETLRFAQSDNCKKSLCDLLVTS